MSDLSLPAFMLDCREWMVVSPETAALGAAPQDSPTVAVLSTMVIDEDIHEATGALTVAMIDDAEPLDTRAVAPGADALELLDADADPATRRYVMPAPGTDDGTRSLALLAEFRLDLGSGDELNDRVDALMTSFRWQQRVPAGVQTPLR